MTLFWLFNQHVIQVSFCVMKAKLVPEHDWFGIWLSWRLRNMLDPYFSEHNTVGNRYNAFNFSQVFTKALTGKLWGVFCALSLSYATSSVPAIIYAMSCYICPRYNDTQLYIPCRETDRVFPLCNVILWFGTGSPIVYHLVYRNLYNNCNKTKHNQTVRLFFFYKTYHNKSCRSIHLSNR